MERRPVRRMNPQERIEALREELEAERQAKEEVEDQLYRLRGRLARVVGIATIEEEYDEEEEADDEDE